MKKRIILTLLSMVLILAVTGCSKEKNPKDGEQDTTPTPTGTESQEPGDEDGLSELEQPEYLENDLVKGEYTLEDHITLGQYKGIEVKVGTAEITEDDVYQAIQNELASSGEALTEVTDRAVRLGDTVNIDYEGLKDGVAFDGGTDQEFDLVIGSGSFVPGFEEQIIGAKKGDKLELNVTFPEGYRSEELAGQPVVFKVTVNKIQTYELTQDFITNNTDFATVEEYMEGMEEEVALAKVKEIAEKKANDIYNKIVENSTIPSLPQSVVDYFIRDMKVYYQNMAMAYGFDLATFLQLTGTSEELFEQQAEEYAKSVTTREIVMSAIAKAENISITEEEYQQKAKEYAEEYGFETVEEFLENINEDLLREDILYNKIEKLIVDASVEI